jgi:hypothetical protein
MWYFRISSVIATTLLIGFNLFSQQFSSYAFWVARSDAKHVATMIRDDMD